MFHVLLTLPALAVFGAAAGAVLAVMCLFLSAAFLAELLLGLFCRVLRWLVWLPVLIGAFGFMLCLAAPIYLPKTLILAFWGLFALMLGLGYLAAWGLKKLLRLPWD